MAVDPNDKQTLILQAVDDKLGTVSRLNAHGIGRAEHFKVARPAAFVIPIMDEEKRASKTHNVSDFDLLVRVLADEESEHAGIELGMAVFEVKQAMKNGGDKTWGGLAIDFFPGATHWLYVDADRVLMPRAGADIEYKFHYQL